MMKIIKGNLFTSTAQTLVNPIDTQALMKQGTALEMKKRCPTMFAECRTQAANGQLVCGIPYPFFLEGGDMILCLPLQEHPAGKVHLHDISRGLDEILSSYQKWGITSIAFPALGLEQGLFWESVGPLMYQKLLPLAETIDIEIYIPEEIDDCLICQSYLQLPCLPGSGRFDRYHTAQLAWTMELHQKQWNLLLYLIQCLNRSRNLPNIDSDLFMILCCLLFWQNIWLGVEIYSDCPWIFKSDVYKCLWILEKQQKVIQNAGWIQIPKDFQILPSCYTQEEKDAVNQIFTLIRQCRSMEQISMAASVLYAAQQLFEDEERIVRQKSLIKNTGKLFSEYQGQKMRKPLEQVIEQLTAQGWFTLI